MKSNFFLLIILLLISLPLCAEETPTPQKLLNPDWIEKQLKDVGIDQLIAKYNGHQQKEVRLVQSALDLSRHVLREHPEALRSQLQARLVSHKLPKLQQFQILPKDKVQIYAMTPALAQAGGPVIRTFSKRKMWVTGAGFLNNGKHIFTAYRDGYILIWEMMTGRMVRTIETKSRILKMIQTPDLRSIITTDGQVIRIWDINSGKMLHQLSGHKDLISILHISPDGTKCISRAYDSRLICWDIKNGKLLHSFSGFNEYVNCVAFSTDNKQVIIAKHQNYLIYDLESGKKLNQVIPKVRLHDPHRIAITSDNNFVIIEKRRDFYEILDLRSGENLLYFNTFIPPFVFRKMKLSIERNKVVARYSGRIRYEWDIKTGKMLKTYAGVHPEWDLLAISTDGNLILDRGTGHDIKLCDLRKQKMVPFPDGKIRSVYSISISADEKSFVTGGFDEPLKLWDFQNIKLIKSIGDHVVPIRKVCITPDGKRAISSSADKSMKLWDLQSGRILKAIENNKYSVTATALVMTPDGKELIIGTYDHGIQTWNLQSGELISFGIKTRKVSSLAITQGGKQIVSGVSDKKVNIWNRHQRTLTLVSSIEGLVEKGPLVAVSANGKRLLAATNDGIIRGWSNQEKLVLITRFYEGHNGGIRFLKFLQKDQFVLSGSTSESDTNHTDNSLRIWNYETKKLLTTFRLDSILKSAALSPSGKYIIVGTLDGQLHKFRIDNLP